VALLVLHCRLMTKPQGERRGSFNHFIRLWGQMTQRQRRALVTLGTANLIALSALISLLLSTPPSPTNTLSASPLPPQRLEACRRQVGRALFDANQAGLVQTQQDGTILLQLQRSHTVPSGSLRRDADGATWAALEAVAAAQGSCLGFNTVAITITFHLHNAPAQQATARVTLSELFSWSSGEIDDAELALRLDYHPPATATPQTKD
jgi:hypothetical protein